MNSTARSCVLDDQAFDVAHLRIEHEERRVGGVWQRTGKQIWTIDGRIVSQAEFLAAAKGHIPASDYARLARVDASLILTERAA